MCEEYEVNESGIKKRSRLTLHLNGTQSGTAHPLDASPLLLCISVVMTEAQICSKVFVISRVD